MFRKHKLLIVDTLDVSELFCKKNAELNKDKIIFYTIINIKEFNKKIQFLKDRMKC
jgi:hypothetical protein